MNASATVSTPSRWLDSDGRHRLRLRGTIFLIIAFFVALALEGYSFYSLPMSERVHSEEYDVYRPSGSLGLKLGITGGSLFLLIYLYPIRKRVGWLRKIGHTKHWLDFHIVLGITAPVLISFHSTFKFHGIAGIAFWIMWAVAVSGVVGKYLYCKVPRLVGAAESDLYEVEQERGRITRELQDQKLFSGADLERLTALPPHEQVAEMSVAQALAAMVRLDALRLWRAMALRRRHMNPASMALSLGGLLPFGHVSLERVMRLAQQQTRLSMKVLFLSKTHALFHLWHVVHRPFSYSLAVLAIVHIAFVIAIGYF